MNHVFEKRSKAKKVNSERTKMKSVFKLPVTSGGETEKLNRKYLANTQFNICNNLYNMFYLFKYNM